LLSQTFAEQGIGGAAMACGSGYFRLAPGDFCFQRVDPVLQLIHRQPVYILLQNNRNRVFGPLGEKLIQIHRFFSCLQLLALTGKWGLSLALSILAGGGTQHAGIAAAWPLWSDA
jgi:hypothetical protein